MAEEAAEELCEDRLVEAPCFSRGELDFSPAEKAMSLKWASAPGFLDPSAKARHQSELFPER